MARIFAATRQWFDARPKYGVPKVRCSAKKGRNDPQLRVRVTFIIVASAGVTICRKRLPTSTFSVSIGNVTEAKTVPPVRRGRTSFRGLRMSIRCLKTAPVKERTYSLSFE